MKIKRKPEPIYIIMPEKKSKWYIDWLLYAAVLMGIFSTIYFLVQLLTEF